MLIFLIFFTKFWFAKAKSRSEKFPLIDLRHSATGKNGKISTVKFDQKLASKDIIT